MSALDTIADKARAKSEELRGSGGIKEKLADELAEDAEFLRKLKPELIRRRAKGEAPTDARPSAAPPATQLESRPARPKQGGGGALPFVVVGVALVAGVALAKWLDWRGHAHPRW